MYKASQGGRFDPYSILEIEEARKCEQPRMWSKTGKVPTRRPVVRPSSDSPFKMTPRHSAYD
jgi:hypothetical protein